MNNLKILLKNSINIFIGNLQGKKKRASTISAITLLTLGAVGILALYTFSTYSMFMGLGSMGLNNVVLFNGLLTSISIAFILGVMRMGAKQKYNDTDLLLSLPIKKRDIIISKLVGYYLFDFAFEFIMLVPYIVLYQVFVGFNFGILFRGLICLFALPLLSVGLTNFLSFIINRMFNKLSRAEMFKSLLSVVMFMAVMILMLSKTTFYGTISTENAQNFFADRFFTNKMLKFVLQGELINWIYIILLTIPIFIFGTFAFSLNFGKSLSGYRGSIKTLKYGEEKSLFQNLIKKEIKTYFSTPAWIINSIIGPLFILILAIFLAVTGKDKLLEMFMATPDTFPSELLFALITVIFCYFISMTLISCSALSLEGKNMWLLKTCPISEKQILHSKSLLQILIIEPMLLISCIILAISLKASFFEFCILFVTTTTFNVLMAYIGILINLIYPHFDFDDETKVVKQSLAVLVTMVIGAIMTGAAVGIYFLFNKTSMFLIFATTNAFYILLTFATIALLHTFGVKKLRSIQI